MRVSDIVPTAAILLGASLLMAPTLVLSACGSAAAGSVVVSGSSTVEPITIAVAEAFAKDHDDINVIVDGPGTGDGFELFCGGETDINDASSPIAPEQVDACSSNGVDFIELRIGNDGIVMLTSEANDAVACLDIGDIYALVGPESQGINRWNDANALALEVGGSGGLEDMRLSVAGPGEESGTYVSFVELAIEDIAEERGKAPETRADYQSSADDNVIIQGIEGSVGSLGWVGYAFARGVDDVKALGVDGGDGCVLPDEKSISTNEYPLSRPLFIYVNAQRAQDKPEVAAFVDEYLGDSIGSVAEVGYVKQTDEALARTRQRWKSRTTGAA